MPSVRPRSAPFVLAVVLAGCGPTPDDAPSLLCTALVAPADAPDPVLPTDTLDLVLSFPTRPGEPLDVLVRVDSVASEGIVLFPAGPPATVAAAGATLTTRAIWTVCVSSAPRALVFRRADTVPPTKAWLRASTDRPVRVVVQTGVGEGATRDRLLTVSPGRSSRGRWEPPGTPR
ncbi:MAG: hypothetical protein PVI57_09150 [Gemmatimonadota bacterium]|jgi:hypothetical protein